MVKPFVRCCVVLAALSVIACSRSSGPSTPDASATTAAAPKKPPRPRPTPAAGETPADVKASKIVLTTIKDRDTTSPVMITIPLFDGAATLSGTGSARLVFDLDTIETGIPLRNERVRLVFFETTSVGWDTIEIAVPQIPAPVLAAIKDKRKATVVKLDAKVKLHGKESAVPLVVDVTREGERVIVKSAAPIEVKISELGLTDNLRRLSALCMHDSIDDVVKIDATIELAP